MFAIRAVLSLLVSLLGPADNVDHPPKLTFDKTVDYVAWWNGQISKGKKENAFELYKGLYGEEDTKGEMRGGIPAVEGKIGEQYNQVSGKLWTRKDYPDLAKHCDACESFLQIYEKAAKVKDYWQPAPAGKPLYQMTMPILGASRNAAKTYLARAWMKQADQANLLNNAHRVLLRNADHMQQGGTVLCQLVGMAIRSLTYQSVSNALDQRLIDGKELLSTYQILSDADPGTPSFRDAVNLEWAMQLDTLQTCCPGGKASPTEWRRIYDLAAGYLDMSSIEPDQLALSDPQATRDSIDAFLEDISRISTGDLNRAQIGNLQEVQAKFDRVAQKNAALRLLNLKFDGSQNINLRVKCYRHGLMLTLALLAHHQQTGKWPKALDDIDAGPKLRNLKTLRIDPFTGKPFRYELRDGVPWLWSIGADGKDERGGKHDSRFGEGKDGGDFIFWPYQGKK